MKKIPNLWQDVIGPPLYTAMLLMIFGLCLSEHYPFPTLTLKTKHTIIMYEKEDDLKAFAAGINTDLKGLPEKIDDIFCKTEKYLGQMYDIGKGAKATILLCNTKKKFRADDPKWGKGSIAYYSYFTKYIYLDTKHICTNTVAHEITHALVHAYLPEKAKTNHEWLADTIGGAVEYSEWKKQLFEFDGSFFITVEK